jgi:hypothetical protein
MDDWVIIKDETERFYNHVVFGEVNAEKVPHQAQFDCWCEPTIIEMGFDLAGRSMWLYKHQTPTAQAEPIFTEPLIEVVQTTNLIVVAKSMDDIGPLLEGEAS